MIQRASLAAAAAITMAACGTSTTAVAPPSQPASCEEDLAATIDLLQSELPTYDYEPAANLEDLVRNSDLVVAGSIVIAQRAEPATSDSDESWTSLTIEQPEVLFDFAEPTPPPTKIGLPSFWPEGLGDDPLAEAVELHAVQFIAFVDQWGAAPGGLAIDVQGLAVGCASSEAPATPIVEPLPRELSGLSIDQLRDSVAAAGETVAGDLRTGIDGPVLRYPVQATGDQSLMLAEISGTIEIEDACLYINSDAPDGRYPVIWPADTMWNPARSLVVLPSRNAVGDTDRVSGVGSYGAITDVEDIAGPEAAALAASCLDNEFGEIAIVNNQPDAISPDR